MLEGVVEPIAEVLGIVVDAGPEGDFDWVARAHEGIVRLEVGILTGELPAASAVEIELDAQQVVAGKGAAWHVVDEIRVRARWREGSSLLLESAQGLEDTPRRLHQERHLSAFKRRYVARV